MVEAVGIDLLNLLLVLTLAWIFGLLVEHFGYPALMGIDYIANRSGR